MIEPTLLDLKWKQSTTAFTLLYNNENGPYEYVT